MKSTGGLYLGAAAQPEIIGQTEAPADLHQGRRIVKIGPGGAKVTPDEVQEAPVEIKIEICSGHQTPHQLLISCSTRYCRTGDKRS